MTASLRMQPLVARGVPVEVEVTRSGFVESRHTVRVAVVEPDGELVLARGASEEPIFPRSSNKPAQAVAMVEAGLGSHGEYLALAGASHSGQPFHVEAVREVLRRAGLDEDDLQCPPDLPGHEPSRDAVLRAGGGPARVYMNCSGKHSAMLATCGVAGWTTRDYRDPEHPLQRRIADTLTRLSGERPAAVGVDGCGAPVLAVSLHALARLGASLASAPPGTPERALADAYRAHPAWMSGTGRDDELWMTHVPGLVSKGGAEGVHLLGLPDGRGVAVKVDDGNARAAGPVLVAVLEALGVFEAPGVDLDGLAALAERPVFGGGGRVGDVRVSRDR
jgi:L-asparaginase II